MPPKTIKKNKLPNKLSALITLALADLVKVEKREDLYEVAMDQTFHENYGGRRCIVCFAGSVMAQTLKLPSECNMSPSDFDANTTDKLYALDYARQGLISDALERIGVNPDKYFIPSTVEVESYDENKTAFKRDMRKLAKNLEKAGL